MPKLKTHKGAARRFSVTGRGKLRHGRVGRRHLLTTKPAKRMRRLRRSTTVAKVDEKKIRLLIPYV